MILVAGGSGMLGIALRDFFKARGTAVRAVSRRAQAGCEASDVSDPRDVKALFREKYDYVIHSAALSDVDGCEREPLKAHAGNALTAKYLAAACAENGTPLVYVSTDYVFDGRKRTPYETVVKALGGAGECVTDPKEIGPALDRAYASGVPYLVNIITDVDAAYPRNTFGI